MKFKVLSSASRKTVKSFVSQREVQVYTAKSAEKYAIKGGPFARGLSLQFDIELTLEKEKKSFLSSKEFLARRATVKSLIDSLPDRIRKLEQKVGSDNQYVKDLKRQLASMKANQGKSSQDVYRMQAKQLPQQSSSNLTDEALNREIEDWASRGIYEAARHQMSTESPSTKTDRQNSSTSVDKKDLPN